MGSSDRCKVVDVCISRKPQKINPYCFGFVRFGFRNHAIRAIDCISGIFLDGRKMFVSKAKYGRGSGNTNENSKISQDHEKKKQYTTRNVINKGAQQGRSFKNALLGVNMEDKNEA
ncbi:hypothetical protein PIB30_000581 [Stylosanthes scabra]|uniref:RRM domain-containing protein n=1 Tax=Stylosanthes scabra TaxID=79078 RepID=A0ABU6X151_9FABA|nr:hypothetical protein [Stylosanthes scabra]